MSWYISTTALFLLRESVNNLISQKKTFLEMNLICIFKCTIDFLLYII